VSLPASDASGEFVPGKSVEIKADRTGYMKVFKNPDGSHSAEISAVPLHFRDPSKGGAWSDVDSSLVSDPSRPGWLRSKANSWVARFGPTPSVEIDSASGGVQTMAPVGGAAVAAVVGTDGVSVIYPGVWPNVDLRYSVSATGVEEDIMVDGPPGRTSFDFTTGTTSYSLAAGGGMTPVAAASDAMSLVAPTVLDSNGDPVAEAAPSLSALATPGGPGVRVSVDASWSPSYPYVIDPSYTNGSGNMTDYRSDGPSCHPCGVQIGNSRVNNLNTYWRSVGYFTYTPLLGDAVSSMTLELDNQGAGTANSLPFWVTHATAYSYAGAAGSAAILQNNIGTGGTFSDTRLTQFYNSEIESRTDGAALGFGGDEVASYTYKQMNNYLFHINYWTFPTSPSPSGPSNGGTFHTLAPTLSASSTNADGTGIDYYYRIATGSNAETGVVCNSGWIAGATSWSAAGCPLAWNTTYYWHAYAWDGQYDAAGHPIQSAPGPVWSFTTQNRPPSTPGLVSPGGSSGQNAVTTLTPTLTANPSTDPDADPVSYKFQVATGSDGQTGVVAASGWQSGTTWPVPTGDLQNGGTYYWTAIAEDNYGYQSSWASPQEFTVDTTPTSWNSPASDTTSTGTVTLQATSGTGATGATFEAYYKGAWQTIATTTTPGTGTWTGSWNSAATDSNNNFVFPDGPYLLGVQINYPNGPGPLTYGPLVWVANDGSSLPGETNGAANPSEPDLALPSAPGSDPAAKASVDERNASVDVSVNDTTTAGPSSLPLQLSRDYSSGTAGQAGPFGNGWTENYNLSVTADTLYGSTMLPVEDVTQENGSVIRFARDPQGNWSAASQVDATLACTQYTNGNCSQWTFTRAGQTVYLFTGSGQLTSITDLDGYSTTFAYNASGGLTQVTAYSEANYQSVTNPTYRTLTLTWSTCGSSQCVTQVTDPGGKAITYGYTGGQLTSVTDLAGDVTRYGYDTSNRLTTVTDPAGNISTFSYPTAQADTLTEQVTMAGSTINSSWAYSAGYSTLGNATATVTVTNPSTPASTDTFQKGELMGQAQPMLNTAASYDHTTGGPNMLQVGPSGSTETSQVAYNDNGAAGGSVDNIVKQTDATNKVTLSKYTANNLLWCSVDAADSANGRTCPASPPATPPVTPASDPDPGVTINFYNAANLLAYSKDPLGNVTAYAYTASTDAPGANVQYCSVDPVDYQAGVTCPAYGSPHLRGTTSETFNSYGQKLSETDADGATTTYQYSNANFPDKVSSTTSPDGDTTTYTYDGDGNTVKTAVTFGAFASTTLDAFDADNRQYCQVEPYETAKGVTCPAAPPVSPPTAGNDAYLGATITTYDSAGRVIQTTNPLGGINLTEYDANGNAWCTIAPAQVSAGAQCPSTEPANPPGLGDPYPGVTINSYNAQNQLIQVTNPLGGITINKYDVYNNLNETQVESGAANAPTIKTDYTFDADNRKLSTVVSDGNNPSLQTLNSYDPNGKAYCTVSANAYAFGSNGYNCPAWNPTWIAQPPNPKSLYATSYSSTLAYNVTTAFYNADGQQVQTTNPDIETTINAVDGDGRTYCSVDATNLAFWLSANPSGAYPYMCPAAPPTSPSANGYTLTIFDPAGHVLSSTDPTNDTTSYTYSPGGQKLTTTDPRGETTTNCYYYQNAVGQCANSAPPAGGSAYDLYSTTTPATAADPNGETTTDTYWPGNQTETTTTPAGTTTDTYDGNADTTTVGYSATAVRYTAPANVTTTFNVDGTKHSVVDATGTTTYTYDQNSDITGESLAATAGLSNRTVSYGYYPTGTLASVTYPSYATQTNPTVNYAYDPTGAMASETDWLGSTVQFGHDADGNTTSQDNNVSTANPNGTSSTTFSYDAADYDTQAASALAQACGGTETLTQAFSGTGGSRNPDGQVTQDSATYSGSCSEQTGYQRNYSYDAAGRVVYQGASPQGAAANSFAYDPSGEPTTISSHDTNSNFDTYTQTFDPAGETTTQTPVTGSLGATTTYTYDTLGDQTTATVTGGTTTTYSYDQNGHMVTANTPNSTSSYAYNADGLTVATTTGTTTSQYTWNNTSDLALILTDGTNDYIYGPSNTPVEQIALSTSKPTYMTYTTSDSSWLTTNQSGDQTGYWRYDAYGTLAFGTPTSPFGYSGQYTDVTTGLVNDRARWYEPQDGEFMGRDPAFAQTDLAYVYGTDDPVNRVDPTGLIAQPGISPNGVVNLYPNRDYNYQSRLGVRIWLLWDTYHDVVWGLYQVTNAIDFWFDEGFETGNIWVLNGQWMSNTAGHGPVEWNYQYHFKFNPAGYAGGRTPQGRYSPPGRFIAGDRIELLDEITVRGWWGSEHWLIWGQINLIAAFYWF
jgi:RHS repeat-associated protein